MSVNVLEKYQVEYTGCSLKSEDVARINDETINTWCSESSSSVIYEFDKSELEELLENKKVDKKMKKQISELLRLGDKDNEFVRVILFGKTAKVVHFKTGLLIGIRCFDTDEQIKTGQNELLKLLIGLNLPFQMKMN